MVPKYYKPYYRSRSGKYSNETICFNATVTHDIDGGDNFPPPEVEGAKPGITIVPPTNILGNRKVKNFTIKVTANGNDDQIYGALVYVPEGTNPSTILCTGTVQSLYEPNQNIIATFIIPPNTLRNGDGVVQSLSAPTTVTVSNKLARNLNTGDFISLVFATPNGLTAGDGTGGNEPVIVSGTVNFAIKY